MHRCWKAVRDMTVHITINLTVWHYEICVDWVINWLICIWVRSLSAPMHLGCDKNGPFVPHIESWEPRSLTIVPDGPKPKLLISSSSKKKEPRYACPSEARALHSHKMWAEVSSLTPHFLHKGLSSSPSRWRYLLRVLWPIRRPVTTLERDMCWFMLVLSIKQNVLMKDSSVCYASLILELIFTYIPKMQKLLQPLDTEHAINHSMKALCKHRTSHKMKHIYTRISPVYKFIHITCKSTFVKKTKYSYS